MNMFKLYITTVQRICSTMSPKLANEGGWIGSAIAGAAAVAGAALSAANQPSGGGGVKVKPKTVSNSQMQEFDILFDQSALENMYEMGDTLSVIAENDRSWFEDVYRPMQDSIIAVNQAILPIIERTSGEALEDITRSLVSGQAISDVMAQKAQGGFSQGTKDAISAFQNQLKDLPTESERIGQALTNVEGSFSAAGKQLTRDYQSRGQTVTQASKRNLLMEKAKAKAGAAGLASEASRMERLNAAERGAGLSMSAEQAETQIQSAAAGVVAQFGGLAQSAAGVTQNALLDTGRVQTGLVSSDQAGQMAATAGTQQIGSSTAADSIEHTQKGMNTAPVSATGGAAAFTPTPGGPLDPVKQEVAAIEDAELLAERKARTQEGVLFQSKRDDVKDRP